MRSKLGVVWLAGSSAEISQARQVLSSLKQSEVIDELGFMVLQGAFADRLYPGTNTIMTHARYLVFIPAIYRYLEESGKAKGKDADRLSRELQADLRNQLVATNPKELGIIGRDAGGDVARPPSNVYWRVLADLRIAVHSMYEASYHSKLSKGEIAPRRIKDDDGAFHQGDSESLWDPNFPSAGILRDGSFPEGISFALTQREARALRARYAALPGGHSLLSHTISYWAERAATSNIATDYPWEVPGVRGDLHEVLDHARRLSLFARGVTLQYHQMLIEKKGEDDRGIDDAFDAWWESADSELKAWDVDGFLRLATQLQAVRMHDHDFLRQWVKCTVGAPSAKDLLRNKSARAIVASREASQRPTKGRLRSAFHLKTWRPFDEYKAEEVYQLTYRHGVGQRFAAEIIAGLKQGPA